MPEWDALFVPSIPVPETLVRGTVTFLALLVMMRVAGQREPGGLGLTDVLIIVLIAEATTGGLVGDAHAITDSILLVATILAWSVAMDALAYRFPKLGRLLKARPRILIDNGRLNHKVMHREFMTREELSSQLRLHGIEDPTQVRCAYLEPNGMVSVLRHNGDVDKPVDSPSLT